MSDLGPDLWNNAPDHSSPVGELRAFLSTILASVNTWHVRANQDDWGYRFASVREDITAALGALPESDVFARKTAVALYEKALDNYQATKDALALSDDWFLTAGEQAGSSTIPILDQLLAYLRQAGIGLGAVAVGLVLLVVVLRFL